MLKSEKQSFRLMHESSNDLYELKNEHYNR